jgi:hypothetical protein
VGGFDAKGAGEVLVLPGFVALRGVGDLDAVDVVAAGLGDGESDDEEPGSLVVVEDGRPGMLVSL